MAKNTRTSIFNRTIPGGVHLFEDMSRSTGNRFFVDSGATTFGDGTTPDAPFASIETALGSNITENNGDIIYVMPGHVETVATDGALAIDKDGVEIIGIGRGDNRPLITVNGVVGAAAIISGAGVSMHGFRWDLALDALTDPIQITGAGGEFYDWQIAEASAVECLDLLSISATGTRTILHNMIIRGRNTGDGDALNAIHLDGCDDVQIYNMDITGGDWSEGVIFNEGDEVLNIRLHDLILGTKALEDLTIIMDTNATGEMWEIKNILFDNAANIDECILNGKVHVYDPILVVNADGEKAIEWAGTDSVDT